MMLMMMMMGYYVKLINSLSFLLLQVNTGCSIIKLINVWIVFWCYVFKSPPHMSYTGKETARVFFVFLCFFLSLVSSSVDSWMVWKLTIYWRWTPILLCGVCCIVIWHRNDDDVSSRYDFYIKYIFFASKVWLVNVDLFYVRLYVLTMALRYHSFDSEKASVLFLLFFFYFFVLIIKFFIVDSVSSLIHFMCSWSCAVYTLCVVLFCSESLLILINNYWNLKFICCKSGLWLNYNNYVQ